MCFSLPRLRRVMVQHFVNASQGYACTLLTCCSGLVILDWCSVCASLRIFHRLSLGPHSHGSDVRMFLQVINHGVSSELVERFCTQILHVFELPLELKQQASGGGSLYGYRFREDAGPLEIYQVPGSDDILIAAHSKKLFPHSSEEFW